MSEGKKTSAAFETRGAVAPIEVRAAADGASVQVAGYAAVFNSPTEVGGYFMEQIAPGAFDDVLGDDVRLLVNHTDLPLARSTSGNLRISVDARGLFIEADLDASDPDVLRIVPKMTRGDLREMSFAFRVDVETWDESGDVPLRTINRISELVDVSLVTVPAYPDTEIALRSRDAARVAEARTKGSRGPDLGTMRMRLALAQAAKGGAG